ncbi:uncharacterized protein LOC112904447 isoform X2 [Agrilus planipennis]|uniref:Uncharacterized protein LOC112904447 isoform X2 n=1 Tax=Agrilus planipennis TaxID=224129 RepID=A0A7F5R3Q4_AGRPL|nr:uncharacterized protein LOC112904447 isoform X2 [Agrilus planipennis]
MHLRFRDILVYAEYETWIHPTFREKDYRVALKVRPGLSLSDPTTKDAVKESEYGRNFVKKYYQKNIDEFYPKCGTYADVHYTRNVQEKIFQNPPKPRSHFLSEMHESYTLKQPIADDEIVYPPEPYAKCEVKALGRDEQPKIRPEEKGYYKWLDPYMTTYASTHFPFTKEHWEGISKKDIITYYDIIKAPKAKGFGPKNPPDISPMVPSKKNYMQDNMPFKLKIQERLVHVSPKPVPHSGYRTTSSEVYVPPTNYPLWTYLNNPGVDYPEALTGTSKFQDLCPPGMYKTEYKTIGSEDGVNAIVDIDKHTAIKNVL